MIVLDASAVTELLLQTDLGRRIEARVVRDGDALHAPALLDIEVLQALRRMVQQGHLPDDRAREAVEDLMSLDLTRHQHSDLAERVWDLRDNITVYDAAYVALAEALDAPLLTCDGPLAASPGHAARIELLR